MRLDIYLTERGLCKSRSAAQSLINGGGVIVNGKIAAKNSLEITDDDEVSLVEEKLPKFVSRGGEKLERALELWQTDLNGAFCVDVGASTGGFTDCMLQNGARAVIAVDVGRGQLDEKLRADVRVSSYEQTDIRDFTLKDGEFADFIGADVSFISLKLVLPHIYRLLKNGGFATVLIKPQFEVGRKNLSKRGIVRSESVRRACVEDITEYARNVGFEITGTAPSPIKGGDGNVEFLLMLRK